MKPRIASSKKWTAFPTELAEQIHSIFRENFEKKLENGDYIVEGRIYPEEILFRIGFSPKGRLFQANFEASVNYSNLEQVQEAIDLCMDGTASMMEQYYDSVEMIDLPRKWEEFVMGKKEIYLQFSTVNSSLESEADKILGINKSGLVYEDEGPDDQDNPDDQGNPQDQ